MNNHIKRKKQKHVEKKMKSQSLVSMFNDILKRYDSSIFIQKILQQNKVNIF